MKIVNASGEYDFTYIYDGDTLVARKDHTSGEVQYYHGDHLSSTDLISDENGAEVETVMYRPFGQMESEPEAETRVGYTGQQHDEQTGQEYYGARYYKTDTRQFISPDTIIQSVYNPIFLNRYAYVANNPFKFLDPDGHVVVQFTGLGGSQDDMTAMANRFSNDISSDVFTYKPDGVAEARGFVQRQTAGDDTEPVIIIGHSLGGSAAMELAADLETQGIDVDLIVTIDKRGDYENIKPEDVDELWNYYRKNGIIRGDYIEGQSNDYSLYCVKCDHTKMDKPNYFVNNVVGRVNFEHSSYSIKRGGTVSYGRARSYAKKTGWGLQKAARRLAMRDAYYASKNKKN